MRQRIRFCRARDGTRIAYATHGQGPPLVKVAHWLTHVEHDWDSPVWRPWLEAFGQRYTMVRYDSRDTGLSDRDVARVSLDAWVEDLEAVVDDLGLSRFPLFAMSQAGPVAIAYAVRHPERVSRVVLCGAYALGRLERDPSQEQHRQVAALMTLMESGWGEDNPALRQLWTTRFLPEGNLEQMRWFNDLQRWSAAARSVTRSMRVRYSLNVSDLARRVTAPTLVLHARRDAVVPYEIGRQLAGLIPGATFVPLDSANHVLLRDEPAWQRFLDEVTAFLDEEVHPRPAALAELTARELELLELVADGLDNAEIAETLVVSPKTVRNHVTSIFAKLGVASRAEAVARARDAGLGGPPVRR